MEYDGFHIECGCRCAICGSYVFLEGYSDAYGNHYCKTCDDYVFVVDKMCDERMPHNVARREQRIERAKKEGEYEE